MAALVAGLLGLVGTVLGATLTTWTARQTDERTAGFSRDEARRQEHRSAVIQFANEAMKYRIAEVNLWSMIHSGRNAETAIAERDCQRTETWNAFYELQLSANRKISQLAERAVNSAAGISRQASQEDMKSRQSQLRNDVATMVTAARNAMPGSIPDLLNQPHT